MRRDYLTRIAQLQAAESAETNQAARRELRVTIETLKAKLARFGGY